MILFRMDIVFDAGEMINVGIELGQIEGALIMSLGWLKSEELSWKNDSYGVEQKGTWNYKVPMHKDIPKTLKIHLNSVAPEFENGNSRKRKQSGIKTTRSGKISLGTCNYCRYKELQRRPL